MLPVNRYILLVSVALGVSAQEWANFNCVAPRSPTNGMSFIFDDGKRVEFRCHPGFKMVGKSLAVCRKNKWTSQPPICVTQSPSATSATSGITYDSSCISRRQPGQELVWAPKISGGYVKKYFSGKNSSYPFNYYVVAIYDCNKGYKLENENNNRMYCRRRTWVGNRPRCIPAGKEQQPCFDRNGGCHHDCSFVNGEVHCSCREGYVLAHDKKFCLRIQWVGNAGVQSDDSREAGNPCKDNGGCGHICQIAEDKAVCRCLNGFKLLPDGKNCADIDECQENNGGCEGTCQNFAGSHTCHCPPGFKLAANRKSCQDQNECLRNNGRGPCSHKCENTRGGYICSCTIPGTVLGADNETCEDIDECKQDNFGCSHFCRNSYGKAFCFCPPGYQLDEDDKTCIDYNECEIEEFARTCNGRCVNEIGSFRCEDTEELRLSTPSSPVCPPGHYIDENGRCEDIDECQNRTIHRCHHKCINTPGSFRCACEDGYSLKRDGVCEDIDECRSRSIHRCHYQCVNTPGSFHCVCPDGFQLHTDGVCEDINECEDNSLGCSHNCQNVRGTAYCTCFSGFKLHDNGKDCIDIDECEDELSHRCHHKCINTIGSYNCSCSPGYIMSSDGICEACRKDFYYSEEQETCIKCPEYSHTSAMGMLSRSDCTCEDGFAGNLTVDDSCTDIDECQKNNGECSHICVNTPGSYYCACPLGYHLDEDKMLCIDTDECLLGKGGCHQGCINTPGSFRCICSQGYVVSEFNHFTCEDINECLKDNGGCSHLCVNHEGGHYCTCKNGYRLASDFRSCVEITCRALPEPHNGKIKCNAPDRDGTMPMNSTCRITCKEGHKASAGTNLRCGEDGDWSGPLPSCVSLSCPSLERPQHGDVHPVACLTGTMEVFGKCFFTCDAGYRLVGRASLKCTKGLKWRPVELPRCESNEFGPFIHCPSDVTVDLKPHQSTHYVRLQRPKSNMDPKHIEIYPKWVENLEGDFPAGVTEVHFIAKHPSKNLTAACRVRVNVEDKEPPNVIGCPGDIAIYADSLDPVMVNWEEPRFEDNVGIESVVKSQTPGTRFNAGSHIIHYTAVDTSRNIAKCEFTVKIMRKECGEPRDFLHGEKNCMDLITSRFCEPICDPGYAFFGNVSEFYMCGADGIWTPSTDIPDCSPFLTEPDEGCMPGTEFREEIDTGSRICVACLQGMYWDSQTSTCIPCPVGSYQDEYGQTSCKPCTEAEASNPLCNEST